MVTALTSVNVYSHHGRYWLHAPQQASSSSSSSGKQGAAAAEAA